ncbi:MAG: hypothetical protein AAGA40_01485 [Cyanobacteria bacterium P01_E01_bin.45]
MTNVFSNDPQRTWDDYYLRKREQRLSEAVMLWQQLEDGGFAQDTIMALDFCCFGRDRPNAEHLADQLEENYQITVTSQDNGYWLVAGTTRPYGVTMGQDEHADWVRFMCDVAQSYGCVFSSWSIEVPALNVKFDSADLESDS